MALPPTVPSSFVPYPGSNTRRPRADFGGAFGFLAYGIFFLMVAASVGVFIYGRILAASKSADDSALAKAEAQLDPNTINNFLRTENRLKLGAGLLEAHVALTALFTQLNAVMPTDVMLESLSLTANTAANGGFSLQSTGVAANLNALAQFSNDLGANKKFQDVIVSGIKVNQKNNSVSFTLTAVAAPSLVAFSASSAQPPPVTTGTVSPAAASTTTSRTATSTP